MARIVRTSLIQAKNPLPATADGDAMSLAAIKQAMLDKHIAMIRSAAADGAEIVCLQEIFNGPYFCAEQATRWQAAAERIPDGPTIQIMMRLAKELGVALVVPIYELADGGVFYNSAAVIGRDGTFVGSYRKAHIPHAAPGFWEKFYFRPGNLGFPVFDLGLCKIGVYLCYDRHFPEGARVMGLNGAEILFNPSAVIAGPNDFLWKIEPPALAVANGYFVAAINRVGTEAPWNLGEFFGQSYFCNPRGRILAEAARDQDEILTADLDLELIAEVRRAWPFNRDRRPELYDDLTKTVVSSES
jgi:N-carbamoylputrescine amidase